MGTATQIWIGSPGARPLMRKTTARARQPCKALLDHLGRHVQGALEKSATTGSATLLWNMSKVLVLLPPWSLGQAMPHLRDSRPATRKARAVHTADMHISEPNGTDIWLDVRIGMAKPDCSLPKELARMENEKRREYGLGLRGAQPRWGGSRDL